jgi:hypothetical protein
MTPSQVFHDRSERLQRAIREERYEDAAREMEAWRAALDNVLRSDPEHARERLLAAGALLERARVRARAGRAGLATQLSRFSSRNPYAARTHGEPAGTWSVLA